MTDLKAYVRWHHQLRKLKGVPGACVDCGSKQKTQWSLTASLHVPGETVFVEDPDAYESRCPSCHVRHDGIGGSTEAALQAWVTRRQRYGPNGGDWSHTDEAKQKIAAAAREHRHTEMTKQKIAAAHLGMTHSTETKAKISANRKGKGTGKRDPAIAKKGWATRRARQAEAVN